MDVGDLVDQHSESDKGKGTGHTRWHHPVLFLLSSTRGAYSSRLIILSASSERIHYPRTGQHVLFVSEKVIADDSASLAQTFSGLHLSGPKRIIS
jgi:hypothetical protein